MRNAGPVEGHVAARAGPCTQLHTFFSPQPDHSFTISINLRESDGFLNGDDNLGDHEVVIDYEDGWRDDDSVCNLADGDQQVEVRMAFTPVP